MFFIGFCVFASILFFYFAWFAHRQSQIQRLQDWMAPSSELDEDTGKKKSTLEVATRFFVKSFGFLFPKGLAAVTLKERLIWAGYGHVTLDTYFTIRMMLLTVPLLVYPLMAGFGVAGWMMGAIIGGVLFLVPEYILTLKIKQRNEQIEKESLPIVELLLTSTQAGLTIEHAIQRITRLNTGLFGQLLRQGYQYMNGLMTREEAFAWMMQQTNQESVHLFIESLSQSGKFGNSISSLLEDQLLRMRNDIQNKGLARAQAANGKIIFPTMLFIFIPLLIMMIGPLLMNLGKMF
jgi:tight adherence protein C